MLKRKGLYKWIAMVLGVVYLLSIYAISVTADLITATEDTAALDLSPLEIVTHDMTTLDMATLDMATLDTATPDLADPDMEVPDTEAQDEEAPDMEVPDAEAPDMEAPDTEAPDAEAQDTEAQDAEAPDMEVPDTEAQDTDTTNTEPPNTTAPDSAPPGSVTILVPEGQTSFSIELLVNESTPYAGIEFALTISGGEDAPAFTSFTPVLSGATASPFLIKDGLCYFGFYSPIGVNNFPVGESFVGVLDFTGYMGNQAITITVAQMDVTRVDMSKYPKETVTTQKASPAYVFTVWREDIATNFYTVTFDPSGGIRADGGELTQTVPEGGAAVAPILTRDGYTFDGWDLDFSNVTSDMTVTAMWAPAGAAFFTVTFDPSGGIRADGGELTQTVQEGGAAVAPVLTRGGYTFDGWDSDFSNVTSDMTVTAIWIGISGSRSVSSKISYTVIFDPAGGTRAGGGALVQSVTSGGAALAPIVVREGYTFNGWDKDYSNIRAKTTVTALWIEDEIILGDDDTPLGATKTHSFDDVTETLYSWALEAVDALAEAGVVKGTAYRIYSPAENIKRGDFILMLYRAYELDEPFTENFPDAPIDSYYYNAIGSTKALGIARGYEDGLFHPEDPISREEMMALIDRTLVSIGKPLPRGSESDLAVFADQDKITDYARDSVAALVKSGIIVGYGAEVNPLAYTTRAEMAVALYRLMILTGNL
ncbi:MAG: S-layer homology domain-containing protein [Oscillospiraceae bacterium]|nr:S-layer homology domain-containing protein [Oscillospiraceae bacterium]